MKPRSFMLIAGEASGDRLAADLVASLREELDRSAPLPNLDYQPLRSNLAPRFFGAGGPLMAAAGVDLAFDMTAHSVIGLWEAIRKYTEFRRLFGVLYRLALERQPDAILCVDFSGFNRQFAKAIRSYVRSRQDWFHDWQPRIIQYVSPQVWASRPDRAYQIAQDYDLLLSTFAFEKEWYARKVPKLEVEFVGNPVAERCLGRATSSRSPASERFSASSQEIARIVLLPGSRKGELRRHVPVLVETAKRIGQARKAAFQMVLPSDALAQYAASLGGNTAGIALQVGRLEEVLPDADLAITKSGTITLECACYGVPALVFYKTSALTYQVGKRVVNVKHIAMPNLLANEAIFPEFIQRAATPDNLCRAALEQLGDPARRQELTARLKTLMGALGGSGASGRAARAVLKKLG